jgi:hypothetical protein
VATVTRVSGTGDIQTSFDLEAGSVQAGGGPVSLTLYRDGKRYVSSGASKLTVAPDGSVDTVPDGTGARVQVTGPSGVVQSYDPTVQPAPTPDPGPLATPAPTPGPGGGGQPPAALKPALGAFSAPKSIKAAAFPKGLKLTLKGAQKGATVTVRVRELKGSKPGKQLAVVTVKAKGRASEVVAVKLAKAKARKLAGKKVRIDLTASLAGATTVTKSATVTVKR